MLYLSAAFGRCFFSGEVENAVEEQFGEFRGAV